MREENGLKEKSNHSAQKRQRKQKQSDEEMRQIVRERLSTLRARKKTRKISEQEQEEEGEEEEEEEEDINRKRGQKRGAHSPSQRMLKTFKRTNDPTEKQKRNELVNRARLKRTKFVRAKNKAYSRQKTRKRAAENESSDDERYKATAKSAKHFSSKRRRATGATMRALRLAQTRAINRRRAAYQVQKARRSSQSKGSKGSKGSKASKEARKRKAAKVDSSSDDYIRPKTRKIRAREDEKSSVAESSSDGEENGRRLHQRRKTNVYS